jgi:ABC-2 type transport system ATP-binding protein
LIAIKTEDLTKYYGTVIALHKLNLEVPENVVFGFLGPNGAGKSTTIKLLTAFARPTSGKAFVAGEEVTSVNLALRAKIGFLPDVPAFYDWMTGREFLHLVGELHNLSANEVKKRADEMLDQVELKKAGDRRIGGYSRGMRQRLGIAQALINHPKVIFMDEPTSALDPIGRREVLELISRLKQNATIFMSTHILSDVERVCDMVGIINKGNLLAVSSMSDLQNQYARSVFEMEFLEDGSRFAEALKSIPWLSQPEFIADHGHPMVRVTAVDVARTKKELPHLIGESGLTLSRYESVMPDLEDVFINVINGRDVK